MPVVDNAKRSCAEALSRCFNCDGSGTEQSRRAFISDLKSENLKRLNSHRNEKALEKTS